MGDRREDSKRWPSKLSARQIGMRRIWICNDGGYMILLRSWLELELARPPVRGEAEREAPFRRCRGRTVGMLNRASRPRGRERGRGDHYRLQDGAG